ncbi:putative tubulin tyrosine ligase [Pseudozyma hubeiensis SY62]|uniref:Putative tubulin tyrosine ligase n=1 Tax=Pseudozyma hubeiensis (strain SY62) TaxID=1305764 RepID=R9P1P2_PSEHS|nr:putative tubulin tyrosine ligase [Pseudozyma hubeiensis SY62]GAC95223.1 putative tubulin tyrosine ligase [Pseudozyma hubeiensis SY62]
MYQTIVPLTSPFDLTSSFGSLLNTQTFSALPFPNLFSAVLSAFLVIHSSYFSSCVIPFIVRQCLKSSIFSLQSWTPPYLYTALSCGPRAKQDAHLSNMSVQDGISDIGVDALW